MENLDSVLADKQLTDLQAELPSSNTPMADPSAEQIEEALKYLKYQNGGLETDGMNDYMGFGDNKICMKVGITRNQLEEIKTAWQAKIAELTPNE